MYNNEPLEYLGLEVPSNHRWNEYATHHLEARWDAPWLFHDTSLDPVVNEAFLQHQWIMTWESSHIVPYTTKVAPSNKTIFFVKHGNHTH